MVLREVRAMLSGRGDLEMWQTLISRCDLLFQMCDLADQSANRLKPGLVTDRSVSVDTQ